MTLALRRAEKFLETFVNDYSNMGIIMMALRCIYQLNSKSRVFFLGYLPVCLIHLVCFPTIKFLCKFIIAFPSGCDV